MDIKPPVAGMVLSLRTRRDVVIADPERFLAAARQAYLELNPGVSEATAAEAVADVHDAAFTLLERDGSLGGPPGHREGPDEPVRPDGLRPAGAITQLVPSAEYTVAGLACFLPADPFALPPEATAE